MAEEFKIFCDESCHLENDGIPVMTLGAVSCPASKIGLATRRIAEVRAAHGLARDFEIKWTKVSRGQQSFYINLVNAFFDDQHLHFRGLLIADKSKLDHDQFSQSHDDWYYKMCFDPIINPANSYSVFLDIKDTRSECKRARLEEVLRNANRDRAQQIIRRVQQVRSNEVILMQLTDLFVGAIGYHARGLEANAAKLAVIKRIRQRLRKERDECQKN